MEHKGYGKTILFGEHFVVYGHPGIAGAISNYTTAKIEDAKTFELIDNRPATQGYKTKKQGEMNRALKLIFNYLNLEQKEIKITLNGNLFCSSGIGASAAMATAIARALNEKYSLKLNEEQINTISYEGEKGSAGNPSGIDNTCATFGGLLVFKKNLEGKKNYIELLKIPKPVEIVLANSGITQETKEVVADVKKLKIENEKEFEQIEKEYLKTYEKGLNALKESNWKKLGEQMNKNHELLQKITVSCKKLDEMQKIALNAGAHGAKLTGTGRGGLMICLTPGKKLQEKVTNTLNNAGINTIKTTIGENTK
jgi:mevalonate kinase